MALRLQRRSFTVNEFRVEILRRPTADGYQDIRRLGRGDHANLLSFPDLRISLAGVLG
ncbi:MAG: hypothetical protein HY712_01375 [candidate division NC10 bacterium]|nr:hypothetical protein [candidate division NC10 bacterium]